MICAACAEGIGRGSGVTIRSDCQGIQGLSSLFDFDTDPNPYPKITRINKPTITCPDAFLSQCAVRPLVFLAESDTPTLMMMKGST